MPFRVMATSRAHKWRRLWTPSDLKTRSNLYSKPSQCMEDYCCLGTTVRSPSHKSIPFVSFCESRIHSFSGLAVAHLSMAFSQLGIMVSSPDHKRTPLMLILVFKISLFWHDTTDQCKVILLLFGYHGVLPSSKTHTFLRLLTYKI